MSLAVAFQMDPLSTINVEADSTYMLAREAQRRGYATYHYLPREMALAGGRVRAKAREFRIRHGDPDPFVIGTDEWLDLATMDVVLLRQDPPFDMAYITTTHLLEHLMRSVLVVNDPIQVRNAPEKLFVTHFAELMPPTLVTSDTEAIMAFRQEHRDIVVKPLFGNGGYGVFHLKPDDENLTALLEMHTRLGREPLMVQRYLPAVREGDKRIILVDGEPVGAVARVPKAGEARANLHVGGQPRKSELTARERDICSAIGPSLRERGLVFVGIDVIGDCLTEINVTSPTGIQEINRLDGVAIEGSIWDAIEIRLSAKRSARA